MIGFDRDPQDVRYPITSLADGREMRSDRNGRIDGRIRIPLAAAAELMRSQESTSGLLTYHAVSSGHSGKGKVRLLEDDPTALSVISDIDDTIEITEVPAGHRVLYLNTIIREFHSAPGMAERYKQWGPAAFHYVSGGPWQLYEPLFEFLPKEGFPDGSVHMRNLPLQVADTANARELIDFLFDKQATKRQNFRTSAKSWRASRIGGSSLSAIPARPTRRSTAKSRPTRSSAIASRPSLSVLCPFGTRAPRGHGAD